MINTNEQLERQLIGLIAVDRFHIVASSLDGKLKRRKENLAIAIDLPKGKFNGERAYARIEFDDKLKSRTMTDAVAAYCEAYPKEGKVLTQMIEDQRSSRETYLSFGVNPGCRLTADDYLGVMADLGFTDGQAKTLYGPLIGTSRAIEKKRDEERSVLIG